MLRHIFDGVEHNMKLGYATKKKKNLSLSNFEILSETKVPGFSKVKDYWLKFR